MKLNNHMIIDFALYPIILGSMDKVYFLVLLELLGGLLLIIAHNPQALQYLLPPIILQLVDSVVPQFAQLSGSAKMVLLLTLFLHSLIISNGRLRPYFLRLN